MDHLSPSTVNVRLSAIRKLVGEALSNGMIGLEEATNLTDVPNVPQKGTRLGNWLTREQAKELLTVPDRSKLEGKRDYVIIALLVGCALRRRELATLNIEDIQLRERRWVIIDTKQWLQDQIIECVNYAHLNGIDSPDLRNWTWTVKS